MRLANFKFKKKPNNFKKKKQFQLLSLQQAHIHVYKLFSKEFKKKKNGVMELN